MYRALLLVCLIGWSGASENFDEELLVRRLPDGHIYTQFRFVVDRGQNDTVFGLFPRSLSLIFSDFHVEELHLSITQGIWRHRRWGYPIGPEASVGTELWAYFKQPDAGPDLLPVWKRLTNALSGAFCTAIQSMDGRVTAAPRWSFQMEGASTANSQLQGLYGSLPGEVPCTNTLTPWTKFLPCYIKAGLSQLLDPHRIFDASYASIGLHLMHRCPSGEVTCANPVQQMVLSLGAVFNPLTTVGLSDTQLSLRELFARKISQSCTLASKSRLLIDVASFGADFSLTLPNPAESVMLLGRFIEYDLLTTGISDSKQFDFSLKFDRNPLSNRVEEKQPISIHRYLAGVGQQSGAIVCQIQNHLSVDIPILYFELFPWYIYAYLHSFKIQSGGKDLQPKKQHYIPSKLRQSPGMLEFGLVLPANSMTTLSIDIEYQLLRWTEYPPDANHGFYIPSAIISAILPRKLSENSEFYDGLPREFVTFTDFLHSQEENVEAAASKTFFVRLYSESLIIYLPTPDFSMPYNALCLVCTVVAIGFGSVHSLTTKRFVFVDPENMPKSLLIKVKEKVLELLKRFRRNQPEVAPSTAPPGEVAQ